MLQHAKNIEKVEPVTPVGSPVVADSKPPKPASLVPKVKVKIAPESHAKPKARPLVKKVEKPAPILIKPHEPAKPIKPAETKPDPPGLKVTPQSRPAQEILSAGERRTKDTKKAHFLHPLPETTIEPSYHEMEVPSQIAEFTGPAEAPKELPEPLAEAAVALPGLPETDLVEKPPLNRFEELVETQPEPEEPVTLEVIQQAVVEEEQPVEETLVQLAHYLEGRAAQPEIAGKLEETGPEMQEIIQIIQEISEELEMVIPHAEPAETKPELTPELTEKIIILFKAVGYKQPEHALQALLDKYDLDFVIEALKYLRQLSDSGQRQEFSKTATATLSGVRTAAPLHRIIAALLLTKSIFYSASN